MILERARRLTMLTVAVLALSGCSGINTPVLSPVSNITTPKMLLDRAMETRSAGDMGSDTKIYLDANRMLLAEGVLSLSVEVYEQRVLVTGLINAVEDCDDLYEKMMRIDHIRELYWHVVCVRRDEQHGLGAIGGFKRSVLQTKTNLRLFVDKDVSDVNIRVAVDSLRNVILLGRVKSEEEREAAIAAARSGGKSSTVAYIEVRP
jgi:osmotically-inducible protein OsmY